MKYIGLSLALTSGLLPIFVRAPVYAAPDPAAPAPATGAVQPVSPSTPPTVTPPIAVQPDYPGAIWTPAADSNFGPADRPTEFPINMVVIHDIEGSAESAIHIFQDPKAHVSAHYVVSSSTGQVFQMVSEHDVAWHAGNLDVNHHSIGIEHEGYAYRPGFYNPDEYEVSAKLVRSITGRYQIPRDRQHIIGHAEVPNPFKPGLFGGASGHTDPGPFWDWDSFMTLVRNDGHLESIHFPAVIHPGEMMDASSAYTNTGDDTWKKAIEGSASGGASTAADGAVYLGTWAPAERTSPFFNYNGWTSPRLAASVMGADSAPGAQAEFAFKLQGPRSLGIVREQFRPMRVPPAPRVPVAFGDVTTATIDVEPWDLTTTAGDSKFTAPGWIRAEDLYWRKPAVGIAQSPAVWNVPLPISGNWDVYARWPSGKNHTDRGSYEVAASDGPHIVVVDQRIGGDWYKLGHFPFGDHQPAQVSLSAPDADIPVADALRVVGPFPE